MNTLSFPIREHTVLIDEEDLCLVAGFTWNLQRSPQSNTLYVRTSLWNPRRCLFLHRLVTRATPGVYVDHRNRNGLDNRKSNLRFCGTAENLWNSEKHRDNTSGYKGVTWHAGAKKWMAQLQQSGRYVYLGLYETPEGAHRAYVEAAIRLRRGFART